MEEKYNWNLEDIFKNNEEFEESQKKLKEKLEKIGYFQNKLEESSKNIYECYKTYEEALEIYEKIYAYGMLKFHLDMAESENIKLYKKVEAIGTDFEKQTSFITPEITKIKDEKILKFIEENQDLKRYERILKEILKNKKHILSGEEEKLLANYSEVLNNMENTYDILTNTEFKFGKLKDEDGKEVTLTDATYTLYLKSKDRSVRRQAFELMYKKYKEFLNTIGELYLGKVKESTITSRLRKYSSSLEKAVDNDDSSIKVYEALINTINKKMEVNHQFLELKKELLDLDEMHLYDIYVNPIQIEKDKISFEDARKEVLEALSILGEEYQNKLKEAFENRWIDVFEKPNKRGGAYSMGVYGVHPYVLTNFVNEKRDVSTIAHELGHSMHSYYSSKNQNVIDSNYTIMVAEVASTVNEILLSKYQIEKETNNVKKAEMIYELLEMIRATLFRQAMFAEFEKEVHNKIEAGEMISAEDMSKLYYELNKKYFGNSTVIDEEIQYEWARIPHFYTPFYVYKYSTGISAAIVIASNILDKKDGYVQKYIEMLKQGCTKKSIDLLKMVDVDLENESTYERAIEFYEENIEELKKLIK